MQTPSAEEQDARRAIESIISGWDTAYSEGSPHGILGHYVPDDRRRGEQSHQSWRVVMDWIEEASARSTLSLFRLDGARASATVEQCRRFSFRRPKPSFAPLGRGVLGWLSRLVFVEREVSRVSWVKTGEGWLCQSEERLSYHVRVKRRGIASPSAV